MFDNPGPPFQVFKNKLKWYFDMIKLSKNMKVMNSAFIYSFCCCSVLMFITLLINTVFCCCVLYIFVPSVFFCKLNTGIIIYQMYFFVKTKDTVPHLFRHCYYT